MVICLAEIILANYYAADPFKYAIAIFIAAAESWFLWFSPAADRYHLNLVIHILVSSIFPENFGGSGRFALKDVRVVVILMLKVVNSKKWSNSGFLHFLEVYFPNSLIQNLILGLQLLLPQVVVGQQAQGLFP